MDHANQEGTGGLQWMSVAWQVRERSTKAPMPAVVRMLQLALQWLESFDHYTIIYS
jgi:hypothetical protein